VFLAGPTPRDKETLSWRPEAISILRRLKYDGSVFYPEWSDKSAKIDYDSQVEWEHTGLTKCKWIVFWIPRNLKNMPAFTTNVEFGRFAHQHNVFYGRPIDAPGNRYLDWYYKKCHPNECCSACCNIYNNLADLLKEIV